VTWDTLIVFLTLAGTVALFVSDRVRLDVVALASLLVLLVTRVLTPQEGLAGFSNPIVVMIAGLFVVGGALSATGVADWLGSRLGGLAGTSEPRLVAVVMLAAALLSAFMSSTGTVAVLLPVVATLARRANISPSRVLMPMAFASLLGGLLTLIGTPPNIVVSDQLRSQGREPFGFFTFTPPGLLLLVVGVAVMVLVGRKLLPGGTGEPQGGDSLPPSRVMRDLAAEYGLAEQLHRLEVPEGSGAAGKSLRELSLRKAHHVTVVGILRKEGTAWAGVPVLPSAELCAGDELIVQAEDAAVARAAESLDLRALPGKVTLDLPGEESIAEVVIPRRSHLVGRTLRAARFRDRYRATVLAVRRAGARVALPRDESATKDLRLQNGDTLLIKGRIKLLQNLVHERRDLVVITDPRPATLSIRGFHAMAAIAATVGMLLLMTFGVVPNVVAVLLAAVAVVLFGCLDTNQAYRGINWESVVLIAAILPMATALDKTGGMRVAVDALVSNLGGHGPRVTLAALFLLTSVFSQVISNTATTVLVAPVAYKVATSLGHAPEPYMMIVAIAASTAFATPIASPVNTLVLNPGGYRFLDYAKTGVLLQAAMLIVSLAVVPLLFPL
jgi:di/tricarboxylate transporter